MAVLTYWTEEVELDFNDSSEMPASSPTSFSVHVGASVKSTGDSMQASPTSSYVSFDPRSRQHRDDVPGSRLSRDFTELSLTSDLKTGTPVATLPSTLRLWGQRWDWLAPVSVYCDWMR